MKKASVMQRFQACTRIHDTSSNISKLTKATVIALSAYFGLYLPGLVINCIFMVQDFYGFYVYHNRYFYSDVLCKQPC